MNRVNVPAMNDLIGKSIPVLDDGHIMLVDYMGDDSSIVQAARVSYGEGTKKISEDRGLIRYLMRHRHTTPFEMCELKIRVRVPMDCWRQWIRHRTACLTADTEVVFNRPVDGKAYRLTVGEIYDRFQPTENINRKDKQKNPDFKKERIQSMQLRCLNEDTNEPTTTQIVDIWQTGKKAVYKLTVETNWGLRSIRASADHMILTDQGWQKLADIIDSSHNIMTISSRKGLPDPIPNEITEDEEWGAVVGWENYYEISTQGRVKRIIGGKGSRSRGRCKRITTSDGRASTTLNRPGVQSNILIHRAMLETFVGESNGMEACHINGNSLDNRIENLRWGTSTDNSQDMVRHGHSTVLTGQACKIHSIEYDGAEMTYDMEVSGPHHNFSANDIIVHNSVNEYSTRYSVAPDAAQSTPPDAWRLQSTINNQGSEGTLNTPEGTSLSIQERDLQANCRSVYESRLELGIAREQARKDLPLSTYTEAYWKINLHNLLNFLRLRCDSHAQYEIRQFANAIRDNILSVWCPVVYEAYMDYSHNGLYLTGPELSLVNSLNSNNFEQTALEIGFAKIKNGKFTPMRELKELKYKLTKLGIDHVI